MGITLSGIAVLAVFFCFIRPRKDSIKSALFALMDVNMRCAERHKGRCVRPVIRGGWIWFVFVIMQYAALLHGAEIENEQAAVPILDLSGKLTHIDTLMRDQQYSKVKKQLEFLVTIANPSTTDRRVLVKLRQRLAKIHRAEGNLYLAIEQLEKAAEEYSVFNDRILAALYYDIAQLYLAVDEREKASRSLVKSRLQLRRTYTDALYLRTEVLRVRLQLERGLRHGIEEEIDTLLELVHRHRDTQAQVHLYYAIGNLYQTAQSQLFLPANLRRKAYDAYQHSLILARQHQRLELIAAIQGKIGALYEYEKRYDEALSYTRKAGFAAQDTADYTNLYQWEWQLARILKARGELDNALLNYRQAVQTMEKVKLALVLRSKKNFKRLISPLYTEFLDLLLTTARSSTDPKIQSSLHREAITTIEAYKLTEVEDYFQSACLKTNRDKGHIPDLGVDTAAVYPVVLQNRIELLVLHGGIIKQYQNLVDRQLLAETVRQFREALQSPNNAHAYLESSRKLYDWVVAPYIDTMLEAKITNLIFVSGSELRTVPFAAFYDGQAFLIEKIRVVNTPSLLLTRYGAKAKINNRVLAEGLTEAVQGYPSLPAVARELNTLKSVFQATLLQDKQFELNRTQDELSEGQYSIVHIATHGEFSSDYRYSYLLTYDDKLTMSILENTIGLRAYRNEPLDLLVLSACKTAVGDERAALGLAGVAIKAGAKSAVATLWYINDAATSLLMESFYKNLKEGASKAEALQQAQIRLIRSKNRSHPYYWAPFLLLGNWT